MRRNPCRDWFFKNKSCDLFFLRSLKTKAVAVSPSSNVVKVSPPTDGHGGRVPPFGKINVGLTGIGQQNGRAVPGKGR